MLGPTQLVAALVAAAALVRAQDYDRHAPLVNNITWVDCQGANGESGYQCGTYDVPLDYQNTAAGKATLAVVRYPASGNKNGSIIINPGWYSLALFFYWPTTLDVLVFLTVFVNMICRWSWYFWRRFRSRNWFTVLQPLWRNLRH